MLERLEISEIAFSNIDHIKNRLDAEYYQKRYLLIDRKIKSIGEFNLMNIKAKLDCSAFYPSITEFYNFEGKGIPFLRVNEIKEGLVKLTESTAFLPQHILDANTGTIAIGYPGDLIIAKGGNTLAKVGLITSQYEKYALSRDIILVRTNDLQGYNKFFLWLFLHCEYGQALLWRTASQTGQPHLTLPSVNEINLPKYGFSFESIIEKLYKESVNLNDSFGLIYRKAEHLLLKEIGLLNFQPREEPVNVKSFKDSFGLCGRLDAEYYQKKYEDYLSLIEAYFNGFEKLDVVCDVKIQNFSPERETQYKYIELSNIGKTGNITGCTTDLGKDLPTRARRVVNANDVIISSIEGSLQSCAIVTSDFDNALCSTGFYVIKSDTINSETLLVLFKSDLMQNILKQNCSGTILTGINKDEFSSIKIPLVSKKIQIKIAELLNESFELKKQSGHLLKVAKRSVEIAIEENEAEALKYIHQNMI